MHIRGLSDGNVICLAGHDWDVQTWLFSWYFCVKEYVTILVAVKISLIFLDICHNKVTALDSHVGIKKTVCIIDVVAAFCCFTNVHNI